MDKDLLQLDAHESRVFGVLVEKSLTTPDQYPLSLNATTAGCNQKSNRHPVLDLSETEVLMALDKLAVRGLVGRVHPAGSRVERFRHNGRERLEVSEAQLAVLAELLMRGPQQPGELRSRAQRMSAIESQEDLTRALEPLQQRGYVKRLPPSPGSRAERYVQLISPDLHPIEAPAAASWAPTPEARTSASTVAPVGAGPRSEELERQVSKLRRDLDLLAEKLGENFDD
jgi:uncharacterized protein YceH (UPF0502 family)